MFYLAMVFFLSTLIVGILAFTGLAGPAPSAMQAMFAFSLTVFIVSFLLSLRSARHP